MLIVFPIIYAYDMEDFRKNEREELRKVFEDEKTIDEFLEYSQKPKEIKVKREITLSRDLEYDMVIITNDNLFNIFSDFADTKNEEGIHKGCIYINYRNITCNDQSMVNFPETE